MEYVSVTLPITSVMGSMEIMRWTRKQLLMLFPEKFAKASQRFSVSLEFYGLHWRGSFTDHTHFYHKIKELKDLTSIQLCFYYFISLNGRFHITEQTPK